MKLLKQSLKIFRLGDYMKFDDVVQEIDLLIADKTIVEDNTDYREIRIYRTLKNLEFQIEVTLLPSKNCVFRIFAGKAGTEDRMLMIRNIGCQLRNNRYMNMELQYIHDFIQLVDRLDKDWVGTSEELLENSINSALGRYRI